MMQLSYRDGIKSFQKLLCLFFSFLTFLNFDSYLNSSPLTANYGTQVVPSLSRLPWKVGLSISCLGNLSYFNETLV